MDDSDEPASKKSKRTTVKNNLDHESDLYSATNYCPELSEEAKAIAEIDCQQGLDKIIDEFTFFMKTRGLQRSYLDLTFKELIEKFPWLTNVSIYSKGLMIKYIEFNYSKFSTIRRLSLIETSACL